MQVTLMTAGALGLLLVFYSACVIAGRVKFRVPLGDGGNETLRQRIRV